MKFVDSCTVRLIAGSGGNGCVAFRREKFVPHGGPSGGDGGRGGNIVFVADPGMSTLLDFTHARIIRADNGEPGRGKDCYGRGGVDRELRVPVGTQIFDVATDTLVCDLDNDGARYVVAKGGRGGRGNIHFATSADRAPRRAEPGEPGEEKDVRLELKVMADVGLLGFPNVGKSTFIRAVSAARPKVADYPFTTLTPHLGVVRVDEDHSFVMADIPGLIPGASEGAGLGIRFLKHVERTRALLHLLTVDPSEGRDPASDYRVLMGELEHFDPELAQRPMIVAMSQGDRLDVKEAFPAAERALAKLGVKLRLVSAMSGDGVRELVRDLHRLVHEGPEEAPPIPPEAAVIPAPSRPSADDATPAADAPKKKTPPAKPEAAKKPAATKTKAKAAKKAKAPAKKAPAKKAPAKKAAAKKKTVKKTPAKKKAAPKKAPTKKKATPKKAAPKKNAPKKKKKTPRRR